jgi:hypothetical protein
MNGDEGDKNKVVKAMAHLDGCLKGKSPAKWPNAAQLTLSGIFSFEDLEHKPDWILGGA